MPRTTAVIISTFSSATNLKRAGNFQPHGAISPEDWVHFPISAPRKPTSSAFCPVALPYLSATTGMKLRHPTHGNPGPVKWKNSIIPGEHMPPSATTTGYRQATTSTSACPILSTMDGEKVISISPSTTSTTGETLPTPT